MEQETHCRFEKNVPGPFYTTGDCLACDAPESEAKNFLEPMTPFIAITCCPADHSLGLIEWGSSARPRAMNSVGAGGNSGGGGQGE